MLWQISRKRELAEVLVECQENPLLAQRPRKNVFVGHPWRTGPNPFDVVPSCSQCVYCSGREVLVGEKAHYSAA
jgi:hypothetical protein